MKKVCVISANCQGAYIKALLESQSEFASDFDCYYFVNYEKVKIPEALLKKCELLIYQPLSEKWDEVSEKYLLNVIPSGCRRVRVNYLTFPIYWPFQIHDARNKPNESYPFGQFPYGDRFVLKLLEQGCSADSVLEKITEKAIILEEAKLDSVIQNYLEKQRDIETRRDQKLLDYIMDSYRKEKLFETFNHPSRALCVHQVNDLLNQLGYENLSKDAPKLEYLTTNQQPIHPVIAEAIGLEFGAGWDEKYMIWGRPLSAREYFRAYTKWDIGSIGVAVEPRQSLSKARNPHKVQTKLDSEIHMKHKEVGQLFFVHIPKTAGTSLNQMLSEAIWGDGLRFKHYNSTVNLIKDKTRRKSPLVMGHIHYDAYKTLSKECRIFTFLRDPVDRTISAFEFMKSHPETWLGQLAQGTLTEFLRNEFVARSVGDVQTRLLGVEIDFHKLYAKLKNGKITEEEYFKLINDAGHSDIGEAELNRAKERLKSLFFVGFTESFSSDAKELFNKIGMQCPEIRESNRTPDQFRRRDKYTPEELSLVRTLNKHDVQLYEFAKNLRHI